MASRGPVGSLGSPDSLDGYERFDGDGVTLLVHQDALAEVGVPGVLRFNFGAFCWCEARLAPSDDVEKVR